MKGGYRFRERQKREWLINLNKTELIVVRNTVIELQSAMKTIALNSSLKVSY
jgi:ribosomal protein L28